MVNDFTSLFLFLFAQQVVSGGGGVVLGDHGFPEEW